MKIVMIEIFLLPHLTKSSSSFSSSTFGKLKHIFAPVKVSPQQAEIFKFLFLWRRELGRWQPGRYIKIIIKSPAWASSSISQISKAISRQNSSPSHNSYNPLPTTSLSFRQALQQIKRHQLFNLLFSSTSNVWHFIKTLWFLSCVTKVSVFEILFPFSPLFAVQKHNVSYLSHNVNCFFYH